MYNLKITPDEDKNNISSSRTSSSKPSGAPRSDKDFKKILGEKDSRQDDDEKDPRNAKFLAGLDGTVEYEEIANAEAPPKKQPSLFDLSKGKVKKNADDETSDVVNMASAEELPMESPNSIFKNLALREKAGAAKGEGQLERAGKKMDDFESDEGKTPTRFPQESIDLTYVNPLALSTKAISEVGDQKLEQASSSKLTMQQLVDAVVKAIATAESQGKTDTVVTLKHPPMFAGSNIVLTSFESAKGEFNIRFENLTQQAKAFMDMQQNQDSLLSTLQQKGYAVHIVVATTQIETPQIVADAQQTSREQQQQQEQRQQQQGRRQKEEEEA